MICVHLGRKLVLVRVLQVDNQVDTPQIWMMCPPAPTNQVDTLGRKQGGVHLLNPVLERDLPQVDTQINIPARGTMTATAPKRS